MRPFLKDFSISRLIHSSWWVVLFILTCYFVFERGQLKIRDDFFMLQNQYDNLKLKKIQVSFKNEMLKRQIHSQEDINSIELMLMNTLGVVPEGQIKVFFTDDPDLLKKTTPLQ